MDLTDNPTVEQEGTIDDKVNCVSPDQSPETLPSQDNQAPLKKYRPSAFFIGLLAVIVVGGVYICNTLINRYVDLSHDIARPEAIYAFQLEGKKDLSQIILSAGGEISLTEKNSKGVWIVTEYFPNPEDFYAKYEVVPTPTRPKSIDPEGFAMVTTTPDRYMKVP